MLDSQHEQRELPEKVENFPRTPRILTCMIYIMHFSVLTTKKKKQKILNYTAQKEETLQNQLSELSLAQGHKYGNNSTKC